MEQYKKIQKLIIELEKIENVDVEQSFDNVTKILKIDINTKEYKPVFGTEVYFGNFKQRFKEIYNTPEELLSILKKLEQILLKELRVIKK